MQKKEIHGIPVMCAYLTPPFTEVTGAPNRSPCSGVSPNPSTDLERHARLTADEDGPVASHLRKREVLSKPTEHHAALSRFRSRRITLSAPLALAVAFEAQRSQAFRLSALRPDLLNSPI